MAVTQLRAERMLKLVEKRFRPYLYDDGKYGPKLVADWDGIPWVIIWEEGPYEWTLAFVSGDVTEEEASILYELADEFGIDLNDAGARRIPNVPSTVKGVWAEPVNSCVLGLFPE